MPAGARAALAGAFERGLHALAIQAKAPGE
jgi:stress-induced morphogen